MLANYKEERAAFARLWERQCQKPILLLCGQSCCGKTNLLRSFRKTAPNSVIPVFVDCTRDGINAAEIFSLAAYHAGSENLPAFRQCLRQHNVEIRDNQIEGDSNQIKVVLGSGSEQERKDRLVSLTDAWLLDLNRLNQLLLLSVDTYEKAGADLKSWLHSLLARLPRACSQLRIVVAGQEVPSTKTSEEWADYCAEFELKGVPDSNLTNFTKLFTERKDNLEDIEKEFSISKKDKSRKSRIRSIELLIGRIENIISTECDYSELEFKTKLWQFLSKESRNYKEFLNSTKNTKNSFDNLFGCKMTAKQQFRAVQNFTEWAIDISQMASSMLDLNKIISRLNNSSITFLGQQLDPSIKNEKKCAILCMRSKCRRAIASNLVRRGQGDKKTLLDIDKHKSIALGDAEKGFNAYKTSLSKFELALCLFANSGTVNSEKARRGMILLEEAYGEGNYIIAGYELVKQLRIRHEYERAIDIFKNIAERDCDRRRFHANVTYFVAAIIGMFYDEADRCEVGQNSLLAFRWLEEIISQEDYRAGELVDYCFVKLILGYSVEESFSALDGLKPVSDMTWNQLSDIAFNLSKGENGNIIGEALLFGIDNARIWSRIGTLYSDFTEDYQKAIDFYSRASLIDSRSPIYHFNKAMTLANKMKKYKEANISFNHSYSLRRNNYSWYQCNKKSFDKLQLEITRNLYKIIFT
ncbi:hypothetical protein VU07_00835 [Desulfobulbus sp. F4]|nr:hypothetical protein [Desulfobulbus sp. F4]